MHGDPTINLLLVEDNPDDAGLAQVYLRLGFGSVDITRVERLADAISAAAERKFDAVLLDLNLPDSSGVETFHKLSARLNGVPIVVLSGMDNNDMAAAAVGAGAEDFVIKGRYDADTLARSVRFAIERSTRMAAERELISMRSELSAAQTIQDSLYPAAAPEITGYEIAGGVRSAGTGCGDYYDFIPLQDGRLLIVVGDVSGHGMGSAIVMAETRACLHTLADVQIPPGRMMSSLNRLICESAPEGMFVTLMLVLLDPQAGNFSYFNAGHIGWIVRADSSCEQLATHQFPLGLVWEADYNSSNQFSLSSGDMLLMPSDGIPESISPSGTPYRSGPMLQTAIQNKTMSASEIVAALFDGAMNHSGDSRPMDDMTAVVLKLL
ncbi:MAG: fused response regulator/phosphatase [Planctomycetaceae bacterium]